MTCLRLFTERNVDILCERFDAESAIDEEKGQRERRTERH
jgi:hypothetical protein